MPFASTDKDICMGLLPKALVQVKQEAVIAVSGSQPPHYCQAPHNWKAIKGFNHGVVNAFLHVQASVKQDS